MYAEWQIPTTKSYRRRNNKQCCTSNSDKRLSKMPIWNLKNLINTSNQRKIHGSNTLMLISSNKRIKNNSDRASKLRINPKSNNRMTRWKMHRRTRPKMRMWGSHRRKFRRLQRHLQVEEHESKAREEAEAVILIIRRTPSMATQMAITLKGKR